MTLNLFTSLKTFSRKFIFLCLIFFISISVFCSESIAQPAIYPDKVIVKFRQNSVTYQNWLKGNRQTPFAEFETLLGSHTTKPFISDATLKFLRIKSTSNSFFPKEDDAVSLQRICVITYRNSINPIIVAKKLSSNPEIEYAEPMPYHTFLEKPNDPKYSLQYYLDTIHAPEAWDVLDTNKTALVGIVDTGVEYTHDDLRANIFVNPGEDGLDKDGKDKRTNGIDDDNNGYIDDWHGWDFSSSDSSGQDNDPKPGHKHGTHLAGTVGASVNNFIGIAGIVKRVKILPVKVGADDPNSTSVDNSYEGVLYAALMGCDVINCSWGSPTRAESEQEVINTAVKQGSVVSAAAGNNGKLLTFYPAGYAGVMSVGAVGSDDRKAYFSNYEKTVDVMAPGEGIYATVTGNWYDFMDGTSMACPVAAGVAGLVKEQFPNYTNLQVIEQMKATCDNIDSVNPTYKGLLGGGRVNALKAVTVKNAKSILLLDYSFSDANKNGLYEAGETVKISASFQNILSPVEGTKVELTSDSQYPPTIKTKTVYFGNLSTLELRKTENQFEFVIPSGLPSNYLLTLTFNIYDTTGVLNTEQMSLVVNPSYKNFTANNISVTMNSNGNIAYNDYPNNTQGIGLLYKNSSNLLFEGALVIGTASDKVSSVARDRSQSEKDNSFVTTQILAQAYISDMTYLNGRTKFKDSNKEAEAGVSVTQEIYQFTNEPYKDFIITSYDIVNTSGTDFDSLFAGLFFDWDIGPSGSYNQADFDFQNGFGFLKNVRDTSLPEVGVKLLSSQKMNYFAIDNNGSGGTNPGIYNGFSKGEKWYMLSSGTKRAKSSVTDVSQMISAGPIRLRKGDTTRVTFSIFAGKEYQTLINAAKNSKTLADEMKISDAYFKPLPKSDGITTAYPNPLSGREMLNIEFAITDNTSATLEIFDALGKRVYSIFKNEYYTPGLFFNQVSLSFFSQGKYFLRLTTNQGSSVFPIVVAR